MKKVFYEGESKVIRRIVELLNLKPELGEGHEDAYYGDLSKEAYEHSQLRSGNPHNITLADLGLEGIIDKIDAIMYAIGMIRQWHTHKGEAIVDHAGDYIVFHGANAENQNYLIWH